MSLSVFRINNNLNNPVTSQQTKEDTNIDFSKLCDPISEAIKKNVKDPIDKEEDLLFWKNTCDAGVKFQKQIPNYNDFVELKKAVMCFPPQTASGKVRRAYREMMSRFPKNVADDLKYTFNCTYNTFVRNKNIDLLNFSAIIDTMDQYTGRVGNPATTDFSLISKTLMNFKDIISEDTKEDESVRQILI